MKEPGEMAEMIAGDAGSAFKVINEMERVVNECGVYGLAAYKMELGEELKKFIRMPNAEELVLSEEELQTLKEIFSMAGNKEGERPLKEAISVGVLDGDCLQFLKMLSGAILFERISAPKTAAYKATIKASTDEEQTEAGNDLGLIGRTDTPRARKYFGRAMERGWIEKTKDGPRWACKETKASRVSFAYLVDRIYTDVVLPNDDIGRTFGIFNISRDKDQLNRRKNRQDWQDMIDEIFID